MNEGPFDAVPTDDLQVLIGTCRYRLEYDPRIGRGEIETVRRLQFQMEDAIEKSAEPDRPGVNRYQGELDV